MKTNRVLTPEQIARRDARRATFRKLVELFKNLNEDQRKELSSSIVSNPDGHVLSIGNTILCQMQRPGSSIVAGYKQWKAFGRHVSKGERGIQIWVPTNAPKNENEPVPDRILFSSVTVFAEQQTEPNAEVAN